MVTLNEVKQHLRTLEEVELLELLDLTSSEIVDAFDDKITDAFDFLVAKLELETEDGSVDSGFDDRGMD